MLERRIHELLRDDRGTQAIQALDGVGRTIGAIFVTEIGDITRFRSPEALCSWAGLDTTRAKAGWRSPRCVDTRSATVPPIKLRRPESVVSTQRETRRRRQARLRTRIPRRDRSR